MIDNDDQQIQFQIFTQQTFKLCDICSITTKNAILLQLFLKNKTYHNFTHKNKQQQANKEKRMNVESLLTDTTNKLDNNFSKR